MVMGINQFINRSWVQPSAIWHRRGINYCHQRTWAQQPFRNRLSACASRSPTSSIVPQSQRRTWIILKINRSHFDALIRLHINGEALHNLYYLLLRYHLLPNLDGDPWLTSSLLNGHNDVKIYTRMRYWVLKFIEAYPDFGGRSGHFKRGRLSKQAIKVRKTIALV